MFIVQICVDFIIDFVLPIIVMLGIVAILWILVWNLFLVRVPLIREILEMKPLPTTPIKLTKKNK